MENKLNSKSKIIRFPKVYYPDYSEVIHGNTITINSYVRKEHNGIFYLWPLFVTAKALEVPFREEFTKQLYDRFHRTANYIIEQGIIDDKILSYVGDDGLPMIYLDENQNDNTTQISLF